LAALSLAPCWLVVTGLNLARDPSSKKLAMSSFTTVRPLSSGALLGAKLRVGAAIWAGALAILGGTWFLFAWVIDGEAPEIRPWGPLFLVICLHVWFGILPLCLTGRMPGFPWSLLPLVLVYSAISNTGYWFSEHWQYAQLLYGLLVALLGLKLLVAWCGFHWSLRLRLVSVRHVLTYTAFWLAACSVIAWCAFDYFDLQGWNGDAWYVPVVAAVLGVPFARIAVSPLAVVLNRHR
jgi:hypothetical protein